MEFLRFGSSIPGSYWGCCAVDIIQNFSAGHPDDKASIEVVCGDGGQPIGNYFLGKTNREIFEARLRIGTFSDSDLPNHAFLCVLTESQIGYGNGLAWLKVLKENGFEFIRAVDNSVYSGSSLSDQESNGYDDEYYDEEYSSPNYLFGLFRNIGKGKIANPFQPPSAWAELDVGVLETCNFVGEPKERIDLTYEHLQQSRDEFHLKRWNEIGPVKFYTKEELKAEGVPITFAGRRSEFPQEPEATREQKQQAKGEVKPAPFAIAV